MAGSATETRLSFAVLQVLLVAGLAFLWLSSESDATATSVDWEFVAMSALTPLVLAGSWWTGRRLDRHPLMSEPAPPVRFVRITQSATIAFLVPMLLIAPLLIVSEIAFGPIG